MHAANVQGVKVEERVYIAQGLPETWDIPQTEMYDEPFHVPKPDFVILEERWDAGEHFRSGSLWLVDKGWVEVGAGDDQRNRLVGATLAGQALRDSLKPGATPLAVPPTVKTPSVPPVKTNGGGVSRNLILLAAGGIMLMMVFALKAALVPLHAWLPTTYAAASPPVAAARKTTRLPL